MRNTQLSGPLCQNCLMTELYCAATRDLERRPCCGVCEHPALDRLKPVPDRS